VRGTYVRFRGNEFTSGRAHYGSRETAIRLGFSADNRKRRRKKEDTAPTALFARDIVLIIAPTSGGIVVRESGMKIIVMRPDYFRSLVQRSRC